jgi:hypothetical protein
MLPVAQSGWHERRAVTSYLAKAGLSPQRVRQHMAGLKFLHTKTRWKPEHVSFLVWPSDRRRLPTVLAVEEVERLLAALAHPKYRVFT